MSYKTRYHLSFTQKFSFSNKRKIAFKFISCTVILGMLLLGLHLRDTEFWREFMIPGDPAETLSAVESFAGSIIEGATFDSAFREFCVDLVQDD